MTSPGPTLRAGAGRSTIDLRSGVLPVDGFDQMLDPLHARALLLDDGANRAVLIALELTSLPPWAVEHYRGIAAGATGAPPCSVLVAVSHTFSAPHLPSEPVESRSDDRLCRVVDSAVRQACRTAAESLSSVTAAFGRARARVNVCRDVPTREGWWLGADDDGPTDDDLPFLRLIRPDGSTVAFLASYPVQSSVLDGSVTSGGHRFVSSDLFGACSRFVERRFDEDTVAIMLPAAAGDQAPALTAVRRIDRRDPTLCADAGEAAHVLVALLGERLASQLLRAADSAEAIDGAAVRVDRTSIAVPAQVPPARREDLRPTRSFSFTRDGDASVPLVVLGLGSLRLVGVQPELNAVTGRELRQRIGGSLILATLVDGGAKYMADAPSYDKMTYEAMNSRFARGSAELLVDAICTFVNG